MKDFTLLACYPLWSCRLMSEMTPEEGLGPPAMRIIRHHFPLQSPSTGDNSPTATFHRLIRSSVVNVVGTPAPNRLVYETPPMSAERPAAPVSHNAGVRPPWSLQWPREQPLSRKYVTMEVQASRRVESAPPESVERESPEAESVAAEPAGPPVELVEEPAGPAGRAEPA